MNEGPEAFAATYGEYFFAGRKNQDYERFEYNFDVYHTSSKDVFADMLAN